MSLPFSSSPNPLLRHRHHSHLFSLPPSTKPQHRTAHNSKTLKLHANSSTTSPPPPTGQPTTTTTTTTTSTATTPFRTRPPSDVTVLTVGSTGYIGNFVVRELCSRGFNVVAVARNRSGIRGRDGRDETLRRLSPASVCFSDVTDPGSLNSLALPPIDVVVCCLASRNGGIKDSWRVDYAAALNALSAARRSGATHFVLLSAVCVQKPLLEFQRAKLKLEAALAAESAKDPNFTYSVVRPTAFFKSLGGQVNLVKSGYPYVVFGDGNLCACKPISEEDLAAFIVDCIFDEEKSCRVLPVGGPGAALTPLEQGEMLFRLLGREPRIVKVPIGVMDFAIGAMEVLARAFPALEDAAEFARIGRYYATESMLVMDEETGEYSAERTPSYGRDTLEDFFRRVIRDGMEGQELGEQSIF